MTHRRCPKLAGQCTETGDHDDHLGPSHRTRIGEAEVEVRLEHWAECPPIIGLYLGAQPVDLDPRGALRAAVALALTAVRLLRLAAQHRTTR